MCDPASAMAGMNMYGGVLGAQASYEQSKNESSYYSYVANQGQKQINEIDKATEQDLGSIDQQMTNDLHKNKQNYDQLAATQKTTMAANGVYDSSGTSQDIADDTIHKKALDEMAIRHNASVSMIEQARSAYSAKNQVNAEILSNQVRSSNANTAGKINTMSSLVGGATQAAGSYASAKKYQK
jgi:hypothetical protein